MLAGNGGSGRRACARPVFIGAVAGALAVILLLFSSLVRGQDTMTPTTGIILSASPTSLSEGASSVTFTISARFASGTDIPNRVINYTIAFPSGISATPNTLTGSVTIMGGQSSGSATHASLTLSGMDNNVVDTSARNITISGSAPATWLSPPTIHSASVPITDDDNVVSLALSAAGSALSEVAERSVTAVTVTASLPAGTTASTSATDLTIAVGGGGSDTAVSGTDFTAAPSSFTLTIPANSLSGTATFNLTAADTIPAGGSKTLTVSGTASGFTFTNSPSLTITDSPVEPTDPTEPSTPTGPTGPPPPTGPTGPTGPPPPRPPDPFSSTNPTLAELLPGWSACLGAAAVATRFTDVADWDADPAIRCVTYYRITKGRTPTRFSPVELLPRWQMALFLYRAAAPAGVSLPPEPAEQGFTDIGGLEEEARAAANTVAGLGIMPGTAAREFDPQGLVSRRSMALILHEFLQAATLQPGVTLAGGSAPTGFNDLDGLSLDERRAVGRLFALGIVRGATAGSFAPEDIVTRVQMVRFIARALAFTIARPAGVTIQADQSTASGHAVDLVASVRDEDFRPVPSVPVDLFKAFSSGEVFTDDGRCRPGELLVVTGSQACLVDEDDPVTGATGDVRVRVEGTASGQRVWAWTGAVGDALSAGVRFGHLMFVL